MKRNQQTVREARRIKTDHTLCAVTNTPRSKAKEPLDIAIAWQGRVQFVIPANCEVTHMGGPCIVLPVGNDDAGLELHVTNIGVVPGLEKEVKDQLVHGLLTVRRCSPDRLRVVATMTLQLDTDAPPTLEFRLSKNGPLQGSLWSKPVPGARLCIGFAQRIEAERIAA